MKYVALLRGANPTSAPSAKLVAVFESLGFSDVQTVASSGNVLFTSDETNAKTIENVIEPALAGLLGAHNSVVVRSVAEMKLLVDTAPFGSRAHSPTTYLAVTFFKHAPHTQTVEADPYAVAYEPQAMALCTVNDNTKRPHFMTRLESAYGNAITTRTWGIVRKIADKM